MYDVCTAVLWFVSKILSVYVVRFVCVCVCVFFFGFFCFFFFKQKTAYEIVM